MRLSVFSVHLVLKVPHTTVDSRRLEYGCRMMYTVVPSFLCLRSEDSDVLTFRRLTVCAFASG